jgi:hypothetical protein
MKAIPPLFRYQGLSPELRFERELLLDNKMYFPSPSSFNDPFEARPHLTFSRNARISRKEALEMAGRQAPGLSRNKRKLLARELVRKLGSTSVAEDVVRQMRGAIQENFYGTSIKCFCEESDSLLQWAYYADCHRGIRLEFSGLNRWRFVDDLGVARPVALTKVRYSDEYPIIDADSDFSGDELMSALLTKSTVWRHENEWRALRVQTRPGHQEFDPSDLVSLVLGSRISDADAGALLRICEQRAVPIKVYRARLADSKFSLTLNLIGELGGR